MRKYGHVSDAKLVRAAWNGSRFVGRFASAVIFGFLLSGFAEEVRNVRNRPEFFRSKLQQDDIVFVDSGNAIQGGFVVRVNPANGEKTIISSGGWLQSPFAVAIESDGNLLVSDSGRVIRINPATAAQSCIAENSGNNLGQPCGLVVERPGSIIVANLTDVLRINVASRQIQTVYSGGSVAYPLGVAAALRNELIVLNRAVPSEIVCVSPNGAQRVLSRGGLLKSPQGVAVLDEWIFVTDVATADGNFGIGRVIAIDTRSGQQSTIAEGGYLRGPVGIAATKTGELIVADPYIINPDAPDQFDGGIVKIDPISGKQTLMTRGEGAFLNPGGVAVVPRIGTVNH
jgi:hypothetical protein